MLWFPVWLPVVCTCTGLIVSSHWTGMLYFVLIKVCIKVYWTHLNEHHRSCIVMIHCALLHIVTDYESYWSLERVVRQTVSWVLYFQQDERWVYCTVCQKDNKGIFWMTQRQQHKVDFDVWLLDQHPEYCIRSWRGCSTVKNMEESCRNNIVFI